MRRGLYAITDGSPLPVLRESVARAIDGGAVMVQYRDKGEGADRRLAEAAALSTLCRARGIPLIVNDDVELAARIGADGVHLGKEDGRIEEARSRLGHRAIIGLSCYDQPERALAAARLGADYVAFGSFFPSPTKPDAARAAPELIRLFKRRSDLPVVAIGGITAENGGPLVAAGADMLAVINGLFGAPDVRAAAERYARLFTA